MKNQSIIQKVRNQIREEVRKIQEAKVNSSDKQHIYNAIARQAGLRPQAVKSFIEDNNLDATALMMDVGQRKAPANELVTAIVGTPNNTYFKQIVKKYAN